MGGNYNRDEVIEKLAMARTNKGESYGGHVDLHGLIHLKTEARNNSLYCGRTLPKELPDLISDLLREKDRFTFELDKSSLDRFNEVFPEKTFEEFRYGYSYRGDSLARNGDDVGTKTRLSFAEIKAWEEKKGILKEQSPWKERLLDRDQRALSLYDSYIGFLTLCINSAQ